MVKLVSNWIEVLRTGNLSEDCALDVVSRWLMITRACVFSMTLLSACIGGLLAGLAGVFDRFAFGLVLLGLILAHGANNMVNDYFDVRNGVDSADYPRAKYAPHPILSNLVSVKWLLLAILICNVLDLAIALTLVRMRGWPVMWFAVVGLALSVFYVAPPLKLKHNGLGEVAIFFIWGPLMIGGTYYAMAGELPWSVMWASIPYGLAIMAVVIGKHLDKRDKDIARKVHTLPVILGERGARVLMGALVLGCYASVGVLAGLRLLPVHSLAILLSLPRAIRVIQILWMPMPPSPREAFRIAATAIPRDLREKFDPDIPGHGFPLWPLWFVVWGVWWVRHTGLFLLLGLGLALADATWSFTGLI